MILRHECGCVEYEHGNHLCARHLAMSVIERAKDFIKRQQEADKNKT